MKIQIATWRPWYNLKVSYDERVAMYTNAKSSCAIKGVNRNGLYGEDTKLLFKTPPFKGKSNDDLERLCKIHNIMVDLWVYFYLDNPVGETNALKVAIERWNPDDVHIDVESEAKKNKKYTGAWIRALGKVRPRTWLQSYRVPQLHPEINWTKWLSYIDLNNGGYVIDGIGAQMYPVGWTTIEQWIADFARALTQYERICKTVKRPDMPWFPTLPTFSEHGWTPTADCMAAGIEFLQRELGDRLVGIQFWRQSFLFKDEFDDILALIYSLDNTPSPPLPPLPTTKPVNQFVIEDVYPGMVDNWLYHGPMPT